MKKAISLFFSLIIMLAVAVPAVSASSESTQGRKTEIYKYLTDTLGFNSAAACGIMANVEHESNFNPTRVIRDSNGLPSGGLCMWNGSRFRNLKNYCNSVGYNYLSVAGQLSFLKHELQNNSFVHIYKHLKNVPNTSAGASDAAHYWCYYFEIPSNRSYQASRRASAASRSYWPKYGNSVISAAKLSSNSDEKVVDITKNVTVNWNKLSGNFTNYALYIAEKTNGVFDWSKAKKKSLSKDQRSFKLKASDLGTGKYAIRVKGINAYNGEEGKCENTIKFDIECFKHKLKLANVKEPTISAFGKNTFECKKCGYKKIEKTEKLSEEYFTENKVKDFRLVDRTDTTITLSWKKFKGAEGYRIWKKVGDEWKKIKTLTPDKLTYTVKGLEKAEKHSFVIAAVGKKDSEGNLCYSQKPEFSVYTRPSSSEITKTKAASRKATIKWSPSKEADGYTVYVSDKKNGKYEPLVNLQADSKTYTAKLPKGEKGAYFMVKSFIKTEAGKNIYSERSNIKYVPVA